MNKKVICGGICAATLVFTAAISVISCSTDDEYYAEGNYTPAKKHMTRSVEGNVVPPVIPMKISAGADTAYYDVPFIDAYGKRIVSIVSWDSGYTALTAHPVSPKISAYVDPPSNPFDKYEYKIGTCRVYWSGGNGIEEEIECLQITQNITNPANWRAWREIISFNRTVNKQTGK